MKSKVERWNKIKKGFTLIELLAVIVILAIIALIAVPTVNDIIKEAQKKAFINTVYEIIKAGDLYYQHKDMVGEDINDELFKFPNGADKLKLKGSLPGKGAMMINADGDIALSVTNEKYCAIKKYKNDNIIITEDNGDCRNFEIPILSQLVFIGTTNYGDGNEATITNIDECVEEDKKCKPGVPFIIQVNEEKKYKFYVINDDGNEVTLIMDRNLGEKVAWYKDSSTNHLGPVTALNYLNVQTAAWYNIPVIKNYTYENNPNGTTYEYGYQKFEIMEGKGKLTSKDGAIIIQTVGESKARVLTAVEYSKIKGNWLRENLSQTEYAGYWFLTANPSSGANAIAAWHSGGEMPYYSVFHVHVFGIRPVITLSK